jgi:hypothetical protein
LGWKGVGEGNEGSAVPETGTAAGMGAQEEIKQNTSKYKVSLKRRRGIISTIVPKPRFGYIAIGSQN